ncbi:MAG TPA: 50S ribosomal protein L11 methyltransferase [Pseudomonadales bacterium]|nr:50S ribosomal protein L11 methyltransferase [Pseudomonadales bacterium]
MGWLQLRLVATADRVEVVEDALLALGALSVTLADHRDVPILEPGVGETPLWPEVDLVALFDKDTDTAAVGAALAELLGEAARELPWEHLENRAWEREWLQYFAPLRFGERFWVCPSGTESPDPDAIVMHLDPGLAFGTGTHQTTALCLEWLATHEIAGRDVIDYGCGSGILGVAALLLGAASVRAVDIDPQALTATRDNAARNRIDPAQLVVGEPALLERAAPAGLLLANILAGPLIELAPRLAALVSPGGHAVLSGVLQTQAEAVRAAYLPWFTHLATAQRDEWCRIELLRTERPAPCPR